ncbi:phage integrase [Marinimicrobium agarilyticum]|uniref:phage integrase n=1 Tax=Marinimicrobium agarilyticum TaxID=306546 RepID=UPI001FE11EE2|nr:tyrosine-type recombinase/integrase [Marinimicrobium agarilyticum]
MADVGIDIATRYRKVFRTKSEALRFEAYVRSKHAQGQRKDWNPVKEDKRRLSQLIELWYIQHGAHLAGSKARKNTLLRMAKAMGNPVAFNLTPAVYLEYRHKRFERGISPKTLNNELGYMNAMYSHLYKTDQINYPSPLTKVQPIRQKERELSFLTLDQCRELLSLCQRAGSRSLYMVVRVCLETGCRWNEAQTLRRSQIANGRITFTDTKSGKNRTVPIGPELETDLKAYQPTGHGRLFAKCIKAFYKVVDQCSFQLPKGQSTHVLRHTYASHFMMNGGDILTLQRILGHSTVTLTMRYSHLAPEHLQDALRYRPLSGLGNLWQYHGNVEG